MTRTPGSERGAAGDGRPYRHMIVCALSPRFALTTAVGERGELLQSPTALAPEPGGTQQVGEVSLAAEAFGIHPGMRLGEALARCPSLTLVPPDPAGVADGWERLLVRLESMGAAVEPERPGLVCFDARGLLRLHGGIEGVLTAVRRALRIPVRLGVASSRFAAVAAACRARSRRPEIVGGLPALQGLGESSPQRDREQARAYLAPLPVALLRARVGLTDLPEALERLGVRTLGELAALSVGALADRWPTSWPAAATARSAPGRRASSCARCSSSPRQRRACSFSAGSAC